MIEESLEAIRTVSLLAGDDHIWSLITALRGPDSDTYFAHECKRAFTARIRAMLGFPGHTMCMCRNEEDIATIHVPAELPAWFHHWSTHIEDALDVLSWKYTEECERMLEALLAIKYRKYMIRADLGSIQLLWEEK